MGSPLLQNPRKDYSGHLPGSIACLIPLLPSHLLAFAVTVFHARCHGSAVGKGTLLSSCALIFLSGPTGFDGVYVPLLVDNLAQFLEAFKDHDFYGFSVTVPHKVR